MSTILKANVIEPIRLVLALCDDSHCWHKHRLHIGIFQNTGATWVSIIVDASRDVEAYGDFQPVFAIVNWSTV